MSVVGMFAFFRCPCFCYVSDEDHAISGSEASSSQVGAVINSFGSIHLVDDNGFTFILSVLGVSACTW
jgi:hypothetical protein